MKNLQKFPSQRLVEVIVLNIPFLRTIKKVSPKKLKLHPSQYRLLLFCLLLATIFVVCTY